MAGKPWKTLPTWAKRLLYPALWLAIGLHGAVLLLPLPDRTPPDEVLAPVAEEPVSLTTPPSLPAAAPPQPQTPPSPTVATPSPSPIARTPVPTAPIPPPASPPPAALPAPAAPVPSPTVSPSPVPSPIASSTPSPVPSPSPSVSPESAEPFADFPHYPNSIGGCFGLETCRRVNDVSSFRQVGATLLADLEADGYQVKEVNNLEDDTSRQVYEISKDGTVQYLSVLSSELGSAIYVLASEPLTLADLQRQSSVVN